MPLHWDISNTNAYKANPDDCFVIGQDGEKRLRPDIEVFVFWGGVVNLGTITASNVAEYYGRSKAIEALQDGPMMGKWVGDKREPVYVTPSMVQDMIGLSTNHSTYSTTEWCERIAKYGNNVVEMPAKVIRALVTYEAWKYEQQVNSTITV